MVLEYDGVDGKRGVGSVCGQQARQETRAEASLGCRRSSSQLATEPRLTLRFWVGRFKKTKTIVVRLNVRGENKIFQMPGIPRSLGSADRMLRHVQDQPALSLPVTVCPAYARVVLYNHIETPSQSVN